MRKEFDEIKATHDKLDKAQNHLFFRAVEFDTFIRCKHALEATRDRSTLIMEVADYLSKECSRQQAPINAERLSSLIDIQQNDACREILIKVFVPLIGEKGRQLTEETLTAVSQEHTDTVEKMNKELALLDSDKPKRTEDLANDFEEGLRLVNQQP